MGFRFKRFDYVGGVAPFTGGTDTTSQRSRSEAVCKDFADFIIACGKGWSLDTARNATTTSFVDVPLKDHTGAALSYTAPALFFRNANGAKLFMCVAGYMGSAGIGLDNTYLLQLVGQFTKILIGSIVFSMIPAGSQSEFGSSFDSSFLPSDATRIYGTTQSYQNSAGDKGGFIAVNASGVNYRYGLFVDSQCVGIGGISSDIDSYMIFRHGYFVGRIIGTVAHSDDTSAQSKYGVIRFWDCNSPYSGTGNREFYFLTQYDYHDMDSDVSLRTFGSSFAQNSLYLGDNWTATSSKQDYLRKACCGAIFNAGGSWLDGRNGANIRYFPCLSAELLDNTLIGNSSLSDATRWVPFEIASCSSDLSTNGVITGSGFKGYLDTDLFRCAKCNLNQLYANGAFIGADATNSLLLGWDPNNTDSL